MINLIKADLFRIFKSKKYKNGIKVLSISIIIILIIALFSDSGLYLFSFSDGNMTRGFKIEGGEINTLSEAMTTAMGTGAVIGILSMILVSGITIQKCKSGVFKNTASYGYGRNKIYIAHVTSLIISISILIAISFLSLITIICLVKGINVDKAGSVNMLLGLITYISVCASIISIYTLISFWSESFNLISIFMIFDLFISIMLTSILPDRIQNLIPFSMLREIASESGNEYFGVCLINSMIIIFITTIIGCVIFNKKEIR